ncbi:phosphonate C-P lyase system protein PhnH [Metarhizobium album]|uniref:Phosphonate C-P lyase system protein PhnH n=1 Tax=Metarhizobium album TaxID=2182425 RepID=A0A2U2DGV7_9HYPH|nr:phosphonate C-P lyase system protein PhnH [Rhizobium album]PWE52504.1 phosphonate C-P lyase system protein PhnH [Rhizobium album]
MRIGLDRRGRERIHEDQRAFRRLLEAFAYPGRIVTLAEGRPAHAIVLETLADAGTPLWIEDGFEAIRDRAAAARWPLTDQGCCAFALCRVEALGCLDGFAMGTLADPHLSATVVAEVAALSGGAPFALSGPGVGPEGRVFAPLGLPEAFPAAWARNNAAYPCGVDLILTAGPLCACLPRKTKLETTDVCSR